MMRRLPQHVAAPIVFVVFFVPAAVDAFPSRLPEVQVIDSLTHEVQSSFLAFDEDYLGGVEVVVGDVNGDGVDEYVVAQSGGKDAEGYIRIFSSDTQLLHETQLRSAALNTPELDVAVGDVDGDEKEEIVVGLPLWDRSFVMILDERLQLDRGTARFFHAFSGMKTGAAVAVGDVTGDGIMEIVTGTGQGVAPLMRFYDAGGAEVMPEIAPFAQDAQHGLSLATIDTSGDGIDEVVVGFQNGARSYVKNYSIDAEYIYPVLAEFEAFGRQFYSGVQLDGIDLDGDGTQEIAVSPAGDMQAGVSYFRGDGVQLSGLPLPLFEEDFRGGAHFAVAQMDSDTSAEIVASPRIQPQRGDLERGHKYIEVDLSDQAQYIWEGGYLIQSYLISSGLSGTPTPPGEYEVLKKIENHVYDGEDYFYPNTPWNLRFINGAVGQNYYLHTAYWHDNFGTPQSHGCVNMKEEEAEFVYHWADLGTPVWVHQ